MPSRVLGALVPLPWVLAGGVSVCARSLSLALLVAGVSVLPS